MFQLGNVGWQSLDRHTFTVWFEGWFALVGKLNPTHQTMK